MASETDHLNHAASSMAEVMPKHDPLLANRPMPYRGIFYPLGFAVEIYTNDRQVLEVAMESWGHLRPRQMSATIRLRVGVNDTVATECPPAPTVRAQGHLITFIADAENQATGDLNGGFGFVWVNRATLQHRLYFRYHFLEAIALVLLHAHLAPALHAACVARNGHGMLFCGDSGAGKSTLAYACARAGFTYISDDASYLLRDSDQPHVIGDSHKFRFRPSCIDIFPELEGRALTPRLEGKPSIEVPSAELPGLITAQGAAIHFVILLKRGTNGVAHLTPVATQIALEHLEHSLYPVEEIRSKQRATLQSLVSVPAFEFHYSDLHAAIACLNKLADGAGSGR